MDSRLASVTWRATFSVMINKSVCYIAGVFPATASAPIHWLVHDCMTSNNETVSRQMPWVGNIAKTVTTNRKQFTVTRKLLTAAARHLSITWLFVCHRFDPFALLCNKSFNEWSLGEQWVLFPSNLIVSRNIEILGKQNLLFPSGPVIKCLLFSSCGIY